MSSMVEQNSLRHFLLLACDASRGALFDELGSSTLDRLADNRLMESIMKGSQSILPVSQNTLSLQDLMGPYKAL